MIEILNEAFDVNSLKEEYAVESLEANIISKMSSSSAIYKYSSLNQLKFELNMRSKIIKTARELNASNLKFKTFKEDMCNTEYWTRTGAGGFKLKENVTPADGIKDIFNNSSKYGTECSTALTIVYYKALLDIYPEELFNRVFSDLYLLNWHYIDSDIRTFESAADQLPGDYRYFDNPEYNPDKPEWQGENVVDMGDGTYYGHGIGIEPPKNIIRDLNRHRKPEAAKSAFLSDIITRPKFKYLANLYFNFLTTLRSECFRSYGIFY